MASRSRIRPPTASPDHLYAEVPVAFKKEMEVQINDIRRRRPKAGGVRRCITVLCVLTTVVVVLGGVSVAVWWFVFRDGGAAARSGPEFLGNIVVYPDDLTGSVFSGASNGSAGDSRAVMQLRLGVEAGLVFRQACMVKTNGALDNITRQAVLNDERFRYICLEYANSKSASSSTHRLLIQKSSLSNTCYDVRWDVLSPAPAKFLTDCLAPAGGNTAISGGGQRRFQAWPNNLQPLPAQKLLHDPQAEGGFVSVVAPYWLFGSGVVVVGREEGGEGAPLTVSLDEKELCMGREGMRWFTLCVGQQGEDVVSLHKTVLRKFQALYEHDYDTGSKGILDESIIRKPIWTTMSVGADANAQLDADTVADLATVLAVDQQLPVSQLLLDPRWEGVQHLGEDELDEAYFFRPAALYYKLRSMNITLQLMLHPFITANSVLFANLSNSGYLVRERAKAEVTDAWYWMSLPGEVNLIQTAMLDLTVPEVVDWKKSRLRNLLKSLQGTPSWDSKSGSCRFLGGASGWLSSAAVAHRPDGLQVSSRLHAALPGAVRSICGDNAQLEIPPISADFGILRMADTPISNSRSMSAADNLNAQLSALIPTALTLSLLGHPLFIPSMVGGNPFLNDKGLLEFGPEAESRYPPGERFLRWLGVVLFMPVIEFGVTPAAFDDPSVMENTVLLLNLREKHMEYLLQAARHAWQTREPMIRPLWWHWPSDPETWRVSDQFMVGEEMLVAPVIGAGATSRRVYLPAGGTWVNAQGGRERPGVVEVTAGLDTVPVYFRRPSQD